MPIICRDCKYLEVDYEWDTEQEDEYPVYSCGKGVATRYTDRECKYHEKCKPYNYVEEDTVCDCCMFLDECMKNRIVFNTEVLNDTKPHYVCGGQPCKRQIWNRGREMAKQNFKVQSIDGKPNAAYVYINDRLSKATAYAISHNAGEPPKIDVTLALPNIEVEENGRIHIKNLEEIANALNREELSRLCDIWQELNNEHGRDC